MSTPALDLIGAAALLLWALRMVRTGVSRAFGGRLRHWLAIGTRNRVTAFGVGLAATCALQSSTATVVMTASFAGRALIGTAMALAIMLGADVGTSLVAQALTFNMHWLSPALIVAGVALFMAKDASRSRAIGRALLGLGLLLLSLRPLGEATAPMLSSPVVGSLLTALAQAPALGVVIGAGLTVLASSSLAIAPPGSTACMTEFTIDPLEAETSMEIPSALMSIVGSDLGEIDGEKASLAIEAQAAAARGRVEGLRRRKSHIRPAHAICKTPRATARNLSFWAPVNDDVVVDLPVGRDLDKLNDTLTPIADRLDPKARSALVLRFGILEVVVSPRPLHETEPARPLIGKARDLQLARIGERPPNPFALAAQHLEAVGIVNCAPVVIEGDAVHGIE